MTSEEIIRLKSLGWTYKQIGVKFNVNTKKAYELYLDACNNLGIEPIKSGRGRKIDQKRIEKMKELRCKKCNKKICEAKFGIIEWVCPKCKTFNKVNLTISEKCVID